MNHAVVIQARLNSSRFPQKVLSKIEGKTLVRIIYERLKNHFDESQIIFAIPNTKQNDKLEIELRNFSKNVFRGSELDVLDRYYSCAVEYSLSHVTRVTADCPLICGELIKKNIKSLTNKLYDYCSNTIKPTYPDGLDCETFTFSALEKAHITVRSEHDREHVTPFLKRMTNIGNIKNDVDLSQYRMTVDYFEDLENIADIVSKLGINASLTEILTYDFMNEVTSVKQRNAGSTMSIDQKTWQRANNVIPGGNQFFSKRPRQSENPVCPIYYDSAKKIDITTLEGKVFSDYYLMGVGTNSLGYSDSDVNARVMYAIKKSTTSSLNSILEIELAERLIEISPGMEMVKFAKTGAEANSIAIRIARSFNGKSDVAICGYHGWHDWYLSANLKDGSRLNNHLFAGVQLAGIPDALSNSTHAFEYNDIERFKALLDKDTISCVIMEVQRNIPPSDNFLQKVRKICTEKNVVLIFDECSSGFRETFGGLYKKYNVIPDMLMFGKAMTNGFPLTAVVGHRDLMRSAEQTFISSTYFSESSAYAAGLATLEKMEHLKSWELTTANGRMFKSFWANVLDNSNLDYEIFGLDAMPKFNIHSIDFGSFISDLSSKMLAANILAYETIYPCIFHNEGEKSYSNYCAIFEESIAFLCNNIENYRQKGCVSNILKRLN